MLQNDIRREHNMKRKYIEYKEENYVYHKRKWTYNVIEHDVLIENCVMLSFEDG